MSFRNFAADQNIESRARAELAAGEELRLIVEAILSFICVTDSRTFIYNKSGGFTILRNRQIYAAEVVPDANGSASIVLHYGGHLSSRAAVPSLEQANALALACSR